MKLFGKDKEKKSAQPEPEKLPEEKLPEAAESALEAADAVLDAAEPAAEQAADLVLSIDGVEELPSAETPSRDLRGATKTLPDKKEIEEAVALVEADGEKALAEEAPEEAASAAEALVMDAQTEQALREEPPAEKAPVITPDEEEPPAAPEATVPAGDTAEKAPAQEPMAEEKPLSAVSYESVAEAMETAQKEPTGRFARDAIDDETLLAELYALIGDPAKPKPAAPAETPKPRSNIPPRPVARLTPEALKDVPEEYEDVAEEDGSGVPGWLKGLFILVISLLLGAMTFYAVASDVIGEIF